MQPRLLSFIIIPACMILLLVKAIDLVSREQSFTEAFIVASLSAEEKEEGEEAEGGEEEEEKGEESEEEHEFTDTELKILQRLAARRAKLEEWQSDLEIKENILNITQTKIDQKLDELRALNKQVKDVLDQYNDKEAQKIAGLVKVYENMKAKNAAKIFGEMEMETLLLVVNKMKEKKVALILAQMNPKLARDVTEQYVLFRKLP